jgi:hypothetical protein
MPDIKGIRLNGVECSDPVQDAEFNEWYNNYHIPEISRIVPGVLGASRYKLVHPESGYPKYINIYELNDVGIEKWNEYVGKMRKGEIPYTPGPPFQAIWTTIYRRIYHYKTP